MRFFISIASTVFISTAIVCCAHFEPESRDKTLYFPEAFTLYDAAAPLPGRWWMSFNSEELNQTIEAALAGNLSLQQMNARLLQAEQLARKENSQRTDMVQLVAYTRPVEKQEEEPEVDPNPVIVLSGISELAE